MGILGHAIPFEKQNIDNVTSNIAKIVTHKEAFLDFT
jgi:hypothetical protein